MVNKFIAFSLVLLLLSSASAQTKSDRKQDGLLGYVKSVKEETAEIVVKNGKPVEGKRELQSIKTFDVSGRLLTNYVYSGDKILNGDTLIYDAEGRLIEKKTEHSKFTYLCDRKVYLYDQDGRISEEVCQLSDRGAIGKTVFRYNEKGQKIEEERFPLVEAKLYFSGHTLKRFKYGSDGVLLGVENLQKGGEAWVPASGSFSSPRVAYYANDNVRGSTQLKYDSNGVLSSVTVSYSDGHDNEIETIEYFPDGRIKSGNRYEYQYDKEGNFVRELDYEWITEDGRSFFQPSEVTYREIEYFPSAAIRVHRKN